MSDLLLPGDVAEVNGHGFTFEAVLVDRCLWFCDERRSIVVEIDSVRTTSGAGSSSAGVAGPERPSTVGS